MLEGSISASSSSSSMSSASCARPHTRRVSIRCHGHRVRMAEASVKYDTHLVIVDVEVFILLFIVIGTIVVIFIFVDFCGRGRFTMDIARIISYCRRPTGCGSICTYLARQPLPCPCPCPPTKAAGSQESPRSRLSSKWCCAEESENADPAVRPGFSDVPKTVDLLTHLTSLMLCIEKVTA